MERPLVAQRRHRDRPRQHARVPPVEQVDEARAAPATEGEGILRAELGRELGHARAPLRRAAHRVASHAVRANVGLHRRRLLARASAHDLIEADQRGHHRRQRRVGLGGGALARAPGNVHAQAEHFVDEASANAHENLCRAGGLHGIVELLEDRSCVDVATRGGLEAALYADLPDACLAREVPGPRVARGGGLVYGSVQHHHVANEMLILHGRRRRRVHSHSLRGAARLRCGLAWARALEWWVLANVPDVQRRGAALRTLREHVQL
eukprot:scaffold118843_cov40-Phaeocystis_antarctica.AAC.1